MEPAPPAATSALPSTLANLAAQRREAVERALEENGHGTPTWPGDVERVLACSDYAALSLARHPSMTADLLASGDLANPYPVDGDAEARPTSFAAFAARTRAALAGANDEITLMRALRGLRRREMVRIAWRDIGGLAGLEEALRDASALADALLEGATDWLHERLVARFGEPRSDDGEAQRLTVLGLGKLGACELNFSSDIDLMFAFAEPGETAGGPRTLDSTEFFTRLGRRLIKVLDDHTEDGHVFRVDMRLRPFGGTGPLAMSFDAMEQYYQTHGRDWERYALIRARVVAGDHAGGERLIEHLRPFVYRRYFDFGALESMREMKQLITEEVARRGLTDNVKLGAGGIREIEFTGQAFQMVRGGRAPELRGRRIMTVLAHIGALELLPAHAVEHLTDAYRFLRTLEHRLQQVDDRQTHLLPSDDHGRARLATGMGYADWPSLARDVVRHRQRVGAQFDQVFGAPAREEGEADPLHAAWEGALDDEQAAALLEGLGFGDAAAAWGLIERSRRSNAIRHMDQHARQRLARLAPDLVRACGAQKNDQQTLARVLAVIETVARRSAYLALLAERPLALSQLVRLCSASPWIGRLIARHPVLLDELLDSRTLYAPLDRAGLEADLEARLAECEGDTEREMEALRLFKQANVLKVAAVDVANVMPLMVVSDHLTEIAQTTLRKTLPLVWRDLTARYGEPTFELDGQAQVAPFAIVAYGKLGGLELGYGSDLDLVFIHGSRGSRQHTTGPRVVDNSVFFSRLAQRLIHFLTTLTGDGVLYEVDARLRPEGSAGMMVNSVAGLRQYLHEKAWTWEHQALVRARPVAGDEALGRVFTTIRGEVLLSGRDHETLRDEVRSMRERMRDALGTGRATGFDLKQDPGGIADIEFMVQYGALRWAEKLGDSLNYTDNIRLLAGFASAGLMSARDTGFLMDAYRAYRARVHRLALQEQEVIENEDEFEDQREGVLRLWRELMEPSAADDTTRTSGGEAHGDG